MDVEHPRTLKSMCLNLSYKTRVINVRCSFYRVSIESLHVNGGCYVASVLPMDPCLYVEYFACLLAQDIDK